MRQNDAVALLIILAILVLLGSITWATLIVTKLSSEQRVVFNLNIKSEFAAESALHLAVVKLTNWAKNNAYQDLYAVWEFYGEDLNMNTKLDDFEDINSNKILDKYSLPLDQTLHPSFTEIAPRGVSNLVLIDKKPRLVSKIIETSSDYLVASSIKVIDTSGQLNLNSGSKNLPLVLSNLLEFLNIDLNADELLAHAPFLSYAHLKQFLKQDTFNILRNYITIYGKKKQSNHYIPHNFSFKMDAVKSMGDLFPIINGVEEKIVFNVNSIDTPLFFANVYNIEGYALLLDDISYLEFPVKKTDKSQFNLYPLLFNPSKLTPVIGKVVDVKIDRLIAHKLTEFFEEKKFNLKVELFDRAFKERKWVPSPLFENIESFNGFLDGARENGIVNLLQKKLILSNVRNYISYNSLLNPGKEKVYIDKHMVTRQTGEFIFYPDGLFEIETMGIVISKNGTTLAKSFREAVYNIFDIESINTKKYMNNFKIKNFCIMDDSGYDVVFTLCPTNNILSAKSNFYLDFTNDGFNARVKGEIRKPITDATTRTVKKPVSLAIGAFFDSFSSLEYDASGILPYYNASGECKVKQENPQSQTGVCKYLKGSIYLWYKPFYSLKEFYGFQNLFSLSLFKKEYFESFKLSDVFLFSFLVVPKNILSIYNKEVQNPVIFMEIPALGGEEFIAGVDNKVELLPSFWQLYVIKFDTSSQKVKDYIKIYCNGIEASKGIFYNYDMSVVNKGLMVDYATSNTIVFGYHHNLKRLWNFHLHGVMGEFGISDITLSESQIKNMFAKGRYNVNENSISIQIDNHKNLIRLFLEEESESEFGVRAFKVNIITENKVFDFPYSTNVFAIPFKLKQFRVLIQSSGYEHLKYTESFIYKISFIYLNVYRVK